MEETMVITINASGAAFEGDPTEEIARILKDLAAKILAGRAPEKILDINGNAVGQIEYK